MERINPPEVKAFMIRNGKLIEAAGTLQELGIYSSVFINASAETATDLTTGHNSFGKLLRTKGAESDEGGVVAGFSVVDQPWLTSQIGTLSESIIVKPLVDQF